MSFQTYKKFVEDGDTVIIYLGHDNMLTFPAKKNKVHQTKYGALRHNDLIGAKYGSKIHCSKGWCYVLHPTPELWTINLPHRTQILYFADISMIIFQLDLKSGSVVAEAGTGSGSLSHAILRTIAPNGHLYTFDFHQERVDKAKAEFIRHDVGHMVTGGLRDVCRDGLGLETVADAVFLDLPSPWDVVSSARRALKRKGGRICSFSPCIEQVQRTCQKLEQLGFYDIRTMECLQRPLDVRTVNMPLADLGYDADQYPGIDSDSHGGSVYHPHVGEVWSRDERGKVSSRFVGGRSKHEESAEKERDTEGGPVSKKVKTVMETGDNEGTHAQKKESKEIKEEEDTERAPFQKTETMGTEQGDIEGAPAQKEESKEIKEEETERAPSQKTETMETEQGDIEGAPVPEKEKDYAEAQGDILGTSTSNVERLTTESQGDIPGTSTSKVERLMTEARIYRGDASNKVKGMTYVFKSGLPLSQNTGHTGYLTFATYLPHQ